MARRVDLSEAIDLFLQSKKKPATAEAYSQTLRQAETMLHAMRIRRVNSIEFTHVHALFYDEKKGWPGRRPAPAEGTMNNHRSRLSAFFAWAVRMGYMDQNYINKDDFPRFKGKETLKRRFTRDELELILGDVKSPRDLALLACSGYTGNRIGELVTLRVGQLDLENQEIQYYDHKNDKWKWKPLYVEAEIYLRNWLHNYEQWLGEPLHRDMYLFPRVERPTFTRNVGWTQISDRRVLPYERFNGYQPMLTTLLTKLDRKHGLVGQEQLNRHGQKYHMFRRSIARMMFDQLAKRDGAKDKALRLVQKFLGHSTRAITESYIGLDLEHEELSTYVKGQRLHPDPDEPNAESTNVIPLRRDQAS